MSEYIRPQGLIRYKPYMYLLAAAHPFLYVCTSRLCAPRVILSPPKSRSNCNSDNVHKSACPHGYIFATLNAKGRVKYIIQKGFLFNYLLCERKRKLFEERERERERVPGDIYFMYARACGCSEDAGLRR